MGQTISIYGLPGSGFIGLTYIGIAIGFLVPDSIKK